jgi:hypothetical protein
MRSSRKLAGFRRCSRLCIFWGAFARCWNRGGPHELLPRKHNVGLMETPRVPVFAAPSRTALADGRLLIACGHGPPQARSPQAAPRRLSALQATEAAVAEEGRAQAQPSRRAPSRVPRPRRSRPGSWEEASRTSGSLLSMAKPRHTRIGSDAPLKRVAPTRAVTDRAGTLRPATRSLRDVLAERGPLTGPVTDAGIQALLAVRGERPSGGHGSH